MKVMHYLLFLSCSACLPVFAGAQAGTTLLVKTDASCNWKLDGQSMGPLTADAPRVVLVSAGEHLIEASAAEGVATLRTNVVIDKVEKTVTIQLKGRTDQQSKLIHVETPRTPTDAEAEKRRPGPTPPRD